MHIINNLADLNRLVAESVFCPEPPLSERRALHESGAWRWIAAKPGKSIVCARQQCDMCVSGCWCECHSCPECRGTGNYIYLSRPEKCEECNGTGASPANASTRLPLGHWEPAPFATDPSASYALRQKMRENEWEYSIDFRYRTVDDGMDPLCFATFNDSGGSILGAGEHPDECTAVALASLHALGVEFTLQEGWDQR